MKNKKGKDLPCPFLIYADILCYINLLRSCMTQRDAYLISIIFLFMI